jgi:hypothetical protein
MAYAFVQDVPADERLYREIRVELGEDRPDGLVAHLVFKREGGLRYVDLWDSQADWERFRDERAEPAVDRVLGRYGIPHDHSLVTFERLELVDTWFSPSDTAIT